MKEKLTKMNLWVYGIECICVCTIVHCRLYIQVKIDGRSNTAFRNCTELRKKKKKKKLKKSGKRKPAKTLIKRNVYQKYKLKRSVLLLSLQTDL